MQPDIYATKAGMNCPVDGTPLQMTERLGVEIDYCPTCRGVWLDRSEIEKIIERNVAEFGRAQQPIPPRPAPQYAPPPQPAPQYAPQPAYVPQPVYDPHHVPVHHDVHHDPHHDVHHEERRHHGGGWLGGLFGD